MPQALRRFLDAFPGRRVLVLGDLYLDEYVHGRMEEISKEGPIPVIHIERHTYNPGAAGNTACGLAALGAQVSVVGTVGRDAHAGILLSGFTEHGVDTSGVVVDHLVPTNTYTKISAGALHTPRQEVLRVDTPRPRPLSGSAEKAVLDRIRELLPGVDALVVVDQAGGVVTPPVLELALSLARRAGQLLVGDSRERASSFRSFDLILPNDEEASIAAGLPITGRESLHAAGRRLCLEHGNRVVMITRGKYGITVFEQDGTITDVPTSAQEVFDVCGAGDTVTAVCTLALLAGACPVEAAILGNYGAGVAVARPGTVTVSADDLRQAMAAREAVSPREKLCPLAQAPELVAALRAQGKRIVLTNGCFDLLHAGHVAYLEQARALGDFLVVGLNQDRSVRTLKGPGRPLNPLADRARVLAALSCVDLVVPFPQRTAVSLIRALGPDTYVKGGDYTLDTTNQEERRAVEAAGGKVVLLPELPGRSTTDIAGRLRRKGAS